MSRQSAGFSVAGVGDFGQAIHSLSLVRSVVFCIYSIDFAACVPGVRLVHVCLILFVAAFSCKCAIDCLLSVLAPFHLRDMFGYRFH